MKQTTFASLTFDAKKKRTRREVFLAEMDQVMSWSMLEAIIEPHYPKAGRGSPADAAFTKASTKFNSLCRKTGLRPVLVKPCRPSLIARNFRRCRVTRFLRQWQCIGHQMHKEPAWLILHDHVRRIGKGH